MKSMRDYYDATAYDTAESWYPNELMLPFLRKFVGLLGANPRILDAGCGTGCESMRLTSLGANVVGIDISEGFIIIARERNPGCRFELIDIKQLDDSLGVFDGAISLGVIIHFEDIDLRMVFDNFAKITRPKGFLFLGFIAGAGFCDRRSYLEVNGEEYNRKVHLHQPERVVEVAEKSGFRYYDEWFLEEQLGQWKFLVFSREAM